MNILNWYHLGRVEMIRFLIVEQEVRGYMFKGQIWLESWNKIASGWWGNQPSFLIDITNAVRASQSNLQKVIQNFLCFNSCRDTLSCIIYIMLFYESLIFVLSASRISNNWIPLSALNYSPKFTMDHYVILRRESLDVNK